MISFGHLLAVGGGILWGLSTPLMKANSYQLVNGTKSNFIANVLFVLKSLLLNWKFLASFGLNQLGSVLYTASLSYNPMTISVPISNSVNLAIIVMIGCYRENIKLNLRK
ncbi:hypothetical protein BLOT_005304 [Blomia tropicalis]|nr:hypothetical protein BLOT_005304 [Blomia tropicalis]